MFYCSGFMVNSSLPCEALFESSLRDADAPNVATADANERLNHELCCVASRETSTPSPRPQGDEEKASFFTLFVGYLVCARQDKWLSDPGRHSRG